MAEVKTDLLIDIDEGEPDDKLPDLPLNLKSVRSVSNNITSSLSSPGSTFFTSGTSDGLTTSIKTRSRLSSIFKQRPTILNDDDDPFDLKKRILKNDNYQNKKNSINSPIGSKSVRTGILVSISEDSKSDTVDSAGTNWDILKFEANAIVGDIQLSTKKKKSSKFVSEESASFDFSLISPIYGGDVGRSVINFTNSDENYDNISFEDKSHFDYHRRNNKENISPISSNPSPVKLLDFSACDISDLNVDSIEVCTLSSNPVKNLTNSIKAVKLNSNTNEHSRWNIRLDTNQDSSGMQLLPEVINSNQYIHDSSQCKSNVASNVSSLNSFRRQSLFIKPRTIDHFVTPSRLQNISKKAAPELMTPLTSKSSMPIRSGLATPSRRLSMQTGPSPIRKTLFDSIKSTVAVKNAKTNNHSDEILKIKEPIVTKCFKRPAAPIKTIHSKLPSTNTKVPNPNKPASISKKPITSFPSTSTAVKPISGMARKNHKSSTVDADAKVTTRNVQVKASSEHGCIERYGIKSNGVKSVKSVQPPIKSNTFPNTRLSSLNGTKNAKSICSEKQQIKVHNTNNKSNSHSKKQIDSARKYEQVTLKLKADINKINPSGTYNLTDLLTEFNAKEKKASGVNRHPDEAARNNNNIKSVLDPNKRQATQQKKENESATLSSKTKDMNENRLRQTRRSVIPQPRLHGASKIAGALPKYGDLK